jgi:hypothetical protein
MALPILGTTKFHTGLASEATPDGYFWIDEIIVSKSIIPDPATGAAPPGSGQSALDTAVNALSVGEWSLFKGPTDWPGGTSAFWITTGDLSPGSSQHTHACSFTHTGVHDTVNDKLVLIGCGYNFANYIVYDIASDTWTSTEHANDIIHSYDHVTLDTARGVTYYGSQSGTSQYSVDNSDGTFSSGLPAPWTAFVDTYGMEYWPSRDSVVVWRKDLGQMFERPIGGSFSPFGSGHGVSNSSQQFHHFMTHNPVGNVMYYGGGGGGPTQLWELSSAGITTAISAPGHPGVECTRDKAMCGEITGDLVVFSHDDGTVHRYNGSTWAQVTASMPANLQHTGAQTAAIPLRGYADREVFMLFRADSDAANNVHCYLYRYS